MLDTINKTCLYGGRLWPTTPNRLCLTVTHVKCDCGEGQETGEEDRGGGFGRTPNPKQRAKY